MAKSQTKDIEEASSATGTIEKSRKDLHIPRRLFHLSMGMSCGLIYKYYLEYHQAIHILGVATCVLYILEQVRLNYPEFKSVFSEASKYLLRAEEQLKESASIPFLMGLLLTLLTFPKHISLVAIFTLAISDPLSAIIGIQFGKTKIKEHRSLEGSSAFFFSTLIIHILVLSSHFKSEYIKIVFISFISSGIVTLFDLLEIKIDDNLTIPLVTASSLWLLFTIF